MWDDIRYRYRFGGMVTKLIMINVAVFLAIKITMVFGFLVNDQTGLADRLLRYLMLPADLNTFGRQFWSLITHMFLHEGLLHILFNMLWLYWFGEIFKAYIGESRVLPVYIMGGLAGAAMILLAYNLFPALDPANAYAMGASSAVMAIVLATAATVPNYSIHLLFLGPVKLKWIAAVVVVLDVISIPGGNTGGHIAHLGGALFGYLFAVQFRNGVDLSRTYYNILEPISRFFDFSSKKQPVRRKMRRKRSGMSMAWKNKKGSGKTAKGPSASTGDSRQARVDAILDKISQSGYDSLSKEEKEFLFRMSRE